MNVISSSYSIARVIRNIVVNETSISLIFEKQGQITSLNLDLNLNQYLNPFFFCLKIIIVFNSLIL